MTSEFLFKEVQEIADLIYFESNGKLNYEKSFEFAVQIQKNELFAKAFVITISDSVPTALEAIAIALNGDDGFLPQDFKIK